MLQLDGLYQGRFVNRFGKTQTIYASNLNELRKRMREEQYEDEKQKCKHFAGLSISKWHGLQLNENTGGYIKMEAYKQEFIEFLPA